MSNELIPDEKAISKFKHFFHGKEEAIFQIYSKNEHLNKKSEHFKGYLNSTNKSKLITANQDGFEVAMMISNSKGNGRGASDIIGVTALFADFDDGNMTAEHLLELPIEPHLITESSPGKFHVYWLIKDCEVDEFKPVMKALAQKLGSDTNVCDLPRVMRMPGTINWKYEKPFKARIVHLQKNAEPIPLSRFIKKMCLNVESPTHSKEFNSAPVANSQKLTKSMTERIEAALDSLPSDDRDNWRSVGMAIHSVDQTENGYNLWNSWSQKSKKYDEDDQRKNWEEFRVGKGINIETLFWLANRAKYGSDNSLDEMSLATYFADRFKDELRYDRDNRTWYHFTGVVWKNDAQAPVRSVRKMVHDLCQAEKESPTNDSIHRFRSSSALKGVVSHAELLDELQITTQEFDKNPNLLAVKNGVIDLASGEFRDATAADYLRRQANVEFDAAAACPVWHTFVKSVTKKDRSLYEYIRRCLGYTLFGHADLQIFFLAVGSGSNGKGVLMRTSKNLLGDYAESVAPNLLTSAYSGNANAPSPALAKLFGARMVICTELPTGRKLDDAFVKQYAGGDEITARHGYGNAFSFKPEGKLWLSTNQVPELSVSDEAMWRRLKPIPFQATFTGGDVDPKLEDKLANEYAGILNWMLKGSISFAENGLGTCPAIEKMEEELRKEADSLFAWISECCVKKSQAITQSSLAYDSYRAFMRHFSRNPLSQQAFRVGLEERGFQHKRGSEFNFYEGFCIPD